MTHFSEFLNTDGNNVETSAVYDSGEWKLPAMVTDGDDETVGAKADAATTDPSTTSSVVSILKGILTFLRVSAAGLGKAEDAAAVSGDTGVMALAIRRDTQTSDAAAGDYHGLHVDALGRLRTADRNESSVAKTTVLATSLVVKASAGKLFGFAGYSTTAQFIQVHDTTSLPTDTAIPVLVFPIEANKPFSISLPRAHSCATGITISNSTTGPTKTIGSANTWITAYYE